MATEDISQEFTLKEIDKTRNYFIDKIKQISVLIKKHKKICMILNYTEHLLLLASRITVCVSCFSFFSCYSCWYCKFCNSNKNLFNEYGD